MNNPVGSESSFTKSLAFILQGGAKSGQKIGEFDGKTGCGKRAGRA
jgi:hypothetical protein